jgi:dTDP-glucose 4,6-dehydratase
VGDLRIAVLGANSFSGAAFVRYAVEGGCTVSPLVRPRYDVNSSLLNILDEVDRFKPNVFVNFAALNVVAPSWLHYEDYYRTNVIGMARLVDNLRHRDFLDRYVQVSTPEVYGDVEGELSPGQRFNPSTPYAVSRAACDMHLAALQATFGFPVCFTRTVNVYGPMQQPYRIIPKTVLKIMRGERLQLEGGGTSTRSFIHVRDMAAGIYKVARLGKPGATYHFAADEEIRIRSLVSQVCYRMGVTFDSAVEMVNDRPGKDRRYFLDWKLAREELDWLPKIRFEAGLDQTVAWFKEHAGNYRGRPLEYQHNP